MKSLKFFYFRWNTTTWAISINRKLGICVSLGRHDFGILWYKG